MTLAIEANATVAVLMIVVLGVMMFRVWQNPADDDWW